MNRHFFLSFRNNSILLSALSLFVLAICLIQSCKKTNVDGAGSIDAGYAYKFFTKPANSSAETDAAINLLRNENDKNDFISRLPAEAGVPVWNRLIEQRPTNKTRLAERGTIGDRKGNLLIPLSNDNQTLSALLFAMKKDDKYEFYCYSNHYAYQVSFSDKYSIKQREKVMGLFMSMSNYVFGIHDFVGIPKDLFTDLKGAMPGKDDKTKRMSLVKYNEAPPDILIADEVVGPVSFCAYHFSGNCSCPGNPNDVEALCQDWWQPCSYNVCSEWSCKTFWVVEEDPGNPNSGGNTPPPNGTNTGSNPPATGSDPLPNLFSGGLPNAPCTNCAWYTERSKDDFDEPKVDQCDPMAKHPEEALFNNYVLMESSPSFVQAPNSTPSPDPITGSYIWTVAQGSFGGWKIQAVMNYSYYHDTYYNMLNNSIEHIYDLFYFQTGEAYFVGSQNAIRSTYTTRNPTINQVLDNNTSLTRGISRVIGTVEHQLDLPAVLPFCTSLHLDATDNVDNSKTFYPR